MKFLYPTSSALLNNFIGCSSDPLVRAFGAPAPVYPRVHTWSDDKSLFLEAEIPGVDPATLDVSVKAGELTLKGVRTTRRHGEQTFERRFELPNAVQTSDIKAKLTNGILSLELPLQPTEAPQKIAIAVA